MTRKVQALQAAVECWMDLPADVRATVYQLVYAGNAHGMPTAYINVSDNVAPLIALAKTRPHQSRFGNWFELTASGVMCREVSVVLRHDSVARVELIGWDRQPKASEVAA